MLDRVARMYERDKCHPCITFWSLGNECGYGPAHDAMAAMLRAKDPSRPVQYEVCVLFIYVCMGCCVEVACWKGTGDI